MPEIQRSRDQRLDRLFDSLTEKAQRLRSIYTSDTKCVSEAIKGDIKDNDPKRAEYFDAILRRLKRLPRSSNVEPKLVSKDQPRATQPDNVLPFRPADNPRPSLKDSLGPKAWAAMLTAAAKQELEHPADASGVDESNESDR